MISVDGLSTLPLMQPLGLHRVHHKAGGVKPQTSLSRLCVSRRRTAQQPWRACSRPTSPARTPTTSQPLWTANDDGTGESVALVEFSGYSRRRSRRLPDVLRHHRCRYTRVNVNGGTAIDASGGDIEVALDQEVLAGEAPGLNHI